MSILRILCAIYLSALLPVTLLAQTGTLQGRVSSSETGAPLSGVQLSIDGGQRGAVSGSDGTVVIRSVPVGTYPVVAERVGYQPVRQTVEVRTGETLLLDIQLSQQAVALGGITVVGEQAAYVASRSTGASRMEVPVTETPVSISVITRARLEAQAPQNLEEVVRYTAGVRAEMYGPDNRGDWFSMRGGSEGSTVLDGMRLPLSGWWGNVRNEPYAFDRVEVVRGPASVTFGQNGPGGVVNLVTKLPQPVSLREISGQLGNNEHKQIAGDLTGPIDSRGSLLYRVVGLWKDSGTQVEHAGDERQLIAPALTWRPDALTSLTVHGHYQRDRSQNTVGFFPTEGMLEPAPNGAIAVDRFIGEPDWDIYGGDRLRLGYQAVRQLSEGWTLRHSLRRDAVDGDLAGMYANFWEEDAFLEDGRSVNRTWYTSRTDTEIWDGELFAEGRFALGGTQHTILAGIDGVRSRDMLAESSGAATPLDLYTPEYGTFPYPDPEVVYGPASTTRQFGLMLQDQIKLFDRLIVSAGIRGDYAKNEIEDSSDAGSDNEAWSKRLGVLFLAGGFSPYATYSESFEAIAGADADGDAYKPKRGSQVEAGVKWSPEGIPLLITGAAYEIKEKNRLTQDPNDPLNSIQRGEVTVRGAEAEATIDAFGWDLVGNYTYTDAKVTKSSDPADPYLGKRLHSIPEHSAALWSVRELDFGNTFRLNFGGGVRYVGTTWDGADGYTTPSNTLFDALLAFQHGGWRYALNASNLLNDSYIATCLERGDCWFGNQRKLVGSVTFRW